MSVDTTVLGKIRTHVLQLIIRINKSKPELVKQALRTQNHSPGKQWQLRSKLYALTQTGKLSQYIDHLEILCQRLNIN